MLKLCVLFFDITGVTQITYCTYLQEQIQQYFLDNKHHLTLVMTPEVHTTYVHTMYTVHMLYILSMR